MSCFPTKCPILHTIEYYHFLNDNGALWIWGAVECWVIGLNIFALLCYQLARKRWEGTNSVKVLSCVKVLNEWKKSSFWALVKCLVFPSKYRIYGLHGRVLWALLDMNNFRLEYLFSSTKHLVQGQFLALESHIAVCKPCCWGKGPKIQYLADTFCKHFSPCGMWVQHKCSSQGQMV